MAQRLFKYNNICKTKPVKMYICIKNIYYQIGFNKNKLREKGCCFYFFPL